MFYILAMLTGLTLLGLTLMTTPWLRKGSPDQAAHSFVRDLRSFNLVLASLMVGAGVLWLFAPVAVQAAMGAQSAPSTDPYASLAAAIAVGLGSLGAAYAVGTTGAAAIGVIAEKPEAFGRVLIFVGLSEGIAIYGLIIAFMVLTR